MSKRQLSFPPFRLDPANAQLWRDNEEVSLRRKTFDVLRYLVDHSGQLVTKSALLDAVWPELAVSDSMPAVCVKELRKALGDEAKAPRFIETVHGRGYRFIAKVTSDAPAAAAREQPAAATILSPIIVGRENELAQMQSWCSRALQGQRRVIFIAGEAGIGKTTFVQAFLDSVAEEGTARIGRGQCIEQYGAGEPYMPVLEALSRLGQEPGGERAIELLNRFAPTWLAQMPALLTREERIRLQSEMQGVTQQRMLREMTQALEALAAEVPLVLLLEDLHWSDFSTLELISAIARRSEPARLMIVGTYRAVEILAHDHPLRTMKQELELHRYCEELRLKLLNERDVAGYLAKRFSSNGSQRFDRLAPAIHERTDGNPLFMINLVDYLIDAGLLGSSREASAAESAEILRVNRIEVPRSVRQMVERNLERLKPEEQAVLESASVAGTEFSVAAVAAATERPQSEVEACCMRLSRREQFVAEQGPVAWPDGTVAAGFRFRHALYQEVLYGLLPPGQRVQLHRLIAVREETGYREHVNEVAAELAHHYSRANHREKAVQYLRVVAERAVARGAAVEAEIHYDRALELLGELPQTLERDRQELALQLALGGVLWASRSWSHPEAARAFARAGQLAERLGETKQLLAVLMGQKSVAHGSGQFKFARTLAERMVVAAENSGDRGALCMAHTRLGDPLISLGEYAEGLKHLEIGNSYYDEANPGEFALMGIDALAIASIATLLLGFPDRARQLLKDGLRRAERRDDPFWLGIVHMEGGMVSAFLRDASGALEHAQALRRLADKQPVFEGMADENMGRALMFQGRWAEGVGYSRQAVPHHKRVGLLPLLTWAKLDQAEFFGNQKQIDEGLALVTEALADSEEYALLRSPALRLRADLLAENKTDASAVEGAYRAAIECAQSQIGRYHELQATTHFGRWLKSQRRGAEAHTLLAQVYGWFTEGFDTSALKEARALLDQLSNEAAVSRRPHKSSKNPSVR